MYSVKIVEDDKMIIKLEQLAMGGVLQETFWRLKHAVEKLSQLLAAESWVPLSRTSTTRSCAVFVMMATMLIFFDSGISRHLSILVKVYLSEHF